VFLVIYQRAPEESRNGPVPIDHHRWEGQGDTLHRTVDKVIQEGSQSAAVLPNPWDAGPDEYNDRILVQIKHVPKWYRKDSPLKYIYVPGGIWDTPLGQKKFTEQQCPVDQCYLTTHPRHKADAVLIQNSVDGFRLSKHPGQIWILWLLESPLNSIDLHWLHNKINWTASYRADSTIVTPYEKFVPDSNARNRPPISTRNYAKGKTKLVAWFVSNCNVVNKRLEYARELRRHVTVDIFGACGSKHCPRTSSGGKCDKLLNSDYKFYLSFENSNCEYYITEKFYWNALL
jgi:glycoprotein 3-alpha-L-fucosyltransferase